MNIPCNDHEPGPPPARRDFARRLRELRVPRGFRTARSLARSLEIDENRYTRYERAEVEPDLDMIRRICDTLGVTPNELLGNGSATAPRMAEAKPTHLSDGVIRPNGRDGARTTDLRTAAWLLAEAASALKGAAAGNGRSLGGDSPLAAVARTGALYRSLMEHPFEAITELLADPAIVGAPAGDAAPLQERIDNLLKLLKHG